jgi:CRISPR-associated endoribonuclease Cas6
MRYLITLQPLEHNFSVPINYYHPLGSAIYRLFGQVSPEFSEWLHHRGFLTKEGRPMKLFNFSRLNFEHFSVNNNVLNARGRVHFKFATPLDNNIGQKFIEGIFNSEKICLRNKIAGADFMIESIESLAPPHFGNSESFIMQSPACLSTIIVQNGARKIYYYRPDDSEAESAMEKNLLAKYELLHGDPYSGELKIRLDRTYLERSGRRAHKLITIREGMPDELKIKAFLCPLRIEGSPEIISTAYYCGVGEKNSMGMGFIEKTAER